MKQAPMPFSHPVAVATLHGETHLRLSPNEAERAAIAAALGLDRLEALTLDIAISHAQNGLVGVEGKLIARAFPVCVVSLEPFEQAIETPVALRLAPEGLAERMASRASERGDEDFESPDVIENGVIDFGQMAAEFLALALDPYPRKPGAVFAGGGDPVEEKESPFAALAALKDRR